MSGNATTHPVRRISTPELLSLRETLSNFLKGHGIPHGFPQYLTGKEDHGDIDVVVSVEAWPEGLEFPNGVEGISRRNGFTHAAWPVPGGGHVQVDFIMAPEAVLPQTVLYLSHGTLSNHIGLVCRSIGLQYKMSGIDYIVRNPTTGQKLGTLMLDTDPVKMLRMIRLPEADILQMTTGSYSTKEESYGLLTRIPFFHPDVISLDRMTANNRTREKKRPETSILMAWIAENVPHPGTTVPAGADREAYLQYQREWQEKVLGKEFLESLQPAAEELIARVLKQGKGRDSKQEWFTAFSKLSGIPEAETGQFIWKTANKAERSVADFLKENTPDKVAREHLQTFRNLTFPEVLEKADTALVTEFLDTRLTPDSPWIPCSESFKNVMIGAVPPIHHKGRIFCGEAKTYTNEGSVHLELRDTVDGPECRFAILP